MSVCTPLSMMEYPSSISLQTTSINLYINNYIPNVKDNKNNIVIYIILFMNRNLHYDENKGLEDEDIGFNTSLYNIDIYDKSYLITIGRERAIISKKQHFYLPVYLMNKGRVYKQIGAFEYESDQKNTKDRQKTFLDKDGDVDLNRLGDIILYSFADIDFFRNISIDVTLAKIAEIERIYQVEKGTKGQKDQGEEDQEDQEDSDEDIFELNKGEMKKGKKEKGTIGKSGIFELDSSTKVPDTLQEETESDAKQEKKDFKISTKSKWIEKFMRNNKYDIVETASNGDCFFDTVRLAYKQIGQNTTIAKLRELVIEDVTQETFDLYQQQYYPSLHELQEIKKEMEKMVHENKDLKKRMENEPSKDKRIKIKDDAEALKKKYSKVQEKKRAVEEYLEEFAFMKDITTIDELREYMRRPSFWADSWAIAVLEKKLNIKIIILSKEHFDTNDLNSVMKCTIGENILKPDFYILAEYSGNHYKLISYKTKYIFRFSEIPYDMKKLVVIKCMERNAGSYYNITDFRNFKEKEGVDPEAGNPEDCDEETRTNYEADVVFMYYPKSNAGPKAGQGSGEKIDPAKKAEYSDLNLKSNKDWRKKLDDYWLTPFTVDGLKWSSVEHYYQGAKFKKQNPKFYETFSIDKDDKLGKDVELAIVAGSQSGKKKDVVLRPSAIKIDPDFYGGRSSEEREKALYAKFTQNEDLKEILLLTKEAKLTKHVPKAEAETDCILMKVRKTIREEGPR